MGEPTEVDKKLLSLLKGIDLNNYPFDVESTVPCGQLEQLKRCEWLNLKRNGLRQLPDPIPELIELEYLSLAYNKISELDDNFADLSADSLKILDLRWNRLNNTLASNEHLAHLASLKVLDLSHNAIGLVPSFLEKLKQLTYLSLKATKITAVPPTLFISLTSLTYLDLSDNDLDQMPVQLRRIVGLKTLILNNNPGLISTNLKQIAAFTSLEVLHLKNTGRSLENFPVEIAKCANLYDLDLSENSLPSVPRSLFECGSLKRLNLSDNCIAELPESFDVLIHLETLCISRNELKKIPSGFGKLLNLRSLYMDCNQLTLDGLLNCNLSKMSNLEVFSAAFNLLESIPEALCRCTRLGKLNIMHNKLVNLPESIHFLNLQDLNANENPNLVMPPKHSGLSEVEAKAALFYNIDFSVEHQLAKARQEQKSERLLSHSSSIDSVSGSGSLPRPRTSSTGAGGGNRKLRIQRRKEEEAGRSDAAKVLSAMRKVAEDAKTADVDNTNQLAADFDEHVSKPLRWDERLGGPVTIDYSNYFEDDIGEVEGVHTWYISNFAPVMLDEEENGRFHQKDCYIVLKNSSNGAEITNTIYFWIGKDAEQDKQTCVAIHAVNLRNCIKATCRTVREDQDEESEEFLSVFVSSFYDFQILEGGHGESGFNHYEQQAANQYLFCLNTTTTHMGMHLVELSPESLDPRYIFMLDIGRALFLWVGNKTPKTKLSKAKLLGEKIIKNERRGRGRVLVVRQGAEPSQFWRGLIVDRPETFTFKPSEWLDLNTIKKPNLYNVHIKQVDGGKYFELSQVEQTSWSLNESQLDPRSVCILDAQTAVFVWEGRKSARILKRASVQMAGVLLRTVIRQDDEAGVIVEKQGFESEFFKSFFSTWTSDKVSVDYTKDNQHLPSSDTTAVGGGEEAGTGGKLKEAKASLSALFASRQPDHNVEDMEYDRLYFFEDLKHIPFYAVVINLCTSRDHHQLNWKEGEL
ncbi:protein flightless-1 homolog [Convolutriloba macropyga]|uniref:protein flightless-1 homolog n=1 Tax=Convolutriloba macropyga TaxID=536237 RepID=UPI003F51F030